MYKSLRVIVTLLVVLAAIAVGYALWHHYMKSPWSRDARIRAEIVTIAPDVTGQVVQLNVTDNQHVNAGDVLLEIDRERYQLAVDRAKATLQTRTEQWHLREHEAKRRVQLGNSISEEQRDNALLTRNIAHSEVLEAEAALRLAELNLERSRIVAPKSGQITNLHLYEGNYVKAGEPILALVVDNSFYVQAYFEETKLPAIHEGAKVLIWPMGGQQELTGVVEGISQAITDRNAKPDSQLLANVEPTFNWVRLAQRIPVRISIDEIPSGVRLSAGMTASVQLIDTPETTPEP